MDPPDDQESVEARCRALLLAVRPLMGTGCAGHGRSGVGQTKRLVARRLKLSVQLVRGRHLREKGALHAVAL